MGVPCEFSHGTAGASVSTTMIAQRSDQTKG